MTIQELAQDYRDWVLQLHKGSMAGFVYDDSFENYLRHKLEDEVLK